MTKIRLHRYENVKWGRSHLPFFLRFEEFLKKHFDVESINYNTDGNTFKGRIELQKEVPTFGKTPPMADVDCVIENLDTLEIKVLSFTNYYNHYVCHLAKAEHCSSVLMAHFNWYNLYYYMKKEKSLDKIDKVNPWIFLTYCDFDYSKYRNIRDTTDVLEEKLFWLGSGVNDYRKSVKIIHEKGYLQSINGINHDNYMTNLSKSKICMSYYLDLDKYHTPYDHPGELCYRDMEYAIVGAPFIRIEFKDSLHDPLIPNKHYICIPREDAYKAYEKFGDEGVADLYIKKYEEVKNDDVFLSYVSKNLREWSDKNILGESPEILTYDLLKLEKWKN